MKKNSSQTNINTIAFSTLLISAILVGIPAYIIKGQTAAIVLTIVGWIVLIAIAAAFGSESSEVPIYSVKSDPEIGEDYRLKRDDPCIVRVNVEKPIAPEGQTFISFMDDVKVAGTSYRIDDVELFIYGKQRQVWLEREPKNPHDRNAVKVMGSWISPEGDRVEAMLGYLMKNIAKTMASIPSNYPIEVRLDTMFLPHGKYSTGIRLKLYYPSKRWRKKLDAEATS